MELGSDTRGRAGTTVKNTSHGHPPIGDSGMMHHYKLGLRLAAALNSCNRQGRRQRNLVIRSIAIDCPSRMQLGGQVDAITHNPEPSQLEYLCHLVYDHLPTKLLDYGIHSGAQLAWHINALRAQKNFTDYLQQAIDDDRADRTPSESIGQRLKLIRNLICYRLPRDFMAVNRIQEDVFGRRNLEYGDFTFFSEQLENLFHDPLLTALDEYGIPIQISTKLKGAILPSDNLNEMLKKLRKLAPRIEASQLDSFEKDIMRWAIEEM